MAESPDFLGEPHDPKDPNPWLALYLDQSVPMADAAKVAWLTDVSSRNRQFVLPFTRPFARLAIVLFQMVKALLPHTASSTLLHRILAWSMKTWLSPNANFLIMRHFHLGSQILRFIADNTAHVHIETTPLEPHGFDEIKNDLFVQHDINLYNFVIHLNWQLKERGVPFTPREPLDFSAIRSELPPFEPFPTRWTNFIDLESAIELYTPLYQLLLTDRDFWRATNSLQLDETIALYVARIIGSHAHVALANNKHPLVPMTTLRAGYRLVLHGLATERLHALLVDEKERAARRTSAARPEPRA